MRPIGMLWALSPAASVAQAQQPPSAQACDSDALRRSICAVDDSLRSALVHADTLVLSRLYADDLLVMNYRGVRSTKQMLLGAIGRGTLQFDTLRVHFAVSGLASGSGSQTTGWSRSWERTRDGA